MRRLFWLPMTIAACAEYDLRHSDPAARGGLDALGGSTSETADGGASGGGGEDPVPGDGGGGDGGDEEDEGADLPYDVKLQVGDEFALSDAFLEEGPLPAAIVAVEMEGGSWRLAELEADLPFVVDEADCAHEGNRDVGRDRIFVTWEEADGTVEIDHLDLRYCE